MTATAEPITSHRVPVLLRVAAVLAILLALFDVLGAVMYWEFAPLPINIAILAIAALTIVGAVFAWRGAAWGVWLAAVTRFLSLITTVPVFLDPGAPAEALVPTIAQDVVTVATIVLLLVGLALKRRA